MNLSDLLIEAASAAIRVTDEVVILDPRPTHDGTPVVLVPEVLFKRVTAPKPKGVGLLPDQAGG